MVETTDLNFISHSGMTNNAVASVASFVPPGKPPAVATDGAFPDDEVRKLGDLIAGMNVQQFGQLRKYLKTRGLELRMAE